MAAYRQARDIVIDHHRDLDDHRSGEAGLAFSKMDEAAKVMWCVAWMAGVHAGAAYEHLRLAMVAPRQTCKACHSQGRLWGGRPFRDNALPETPCQACGGVGTVPTPAPSRPR